ncbi:MAG: hypothetical protein B7Z37_20340 [Verrucomicrobia bacterium 12-59-8]|nr:MAG: hypothetical protein B7Z37_20340 [Verrucomicrobia bacterium 12-59-8]
MQRLDNRFFQADELIHMKPIYLVLLLFIFGTYLMWTGISDMVFTAKAKFWPTVQGTVHAKDVWMRSGRGASKDYIPTMRYYYELNGTAYTAERIRHASFSAGSKAEALAKISAYSVGMPTTVHYDPLNPSNAVLQVGSLTHGVTKSGIGLGVLLVGLLLGRPVWKELNSNNFYATT